MTQDKARLEEVILKTCDLPVLPATAHRVLNVMADPNVSIDEIKRVISSDPGLTAKILKIANSAFYGGYRNIQNLTQAILRLGLNSVRNIMMATSIKNVYKRFGLTEKLLWEQSIGSALASNIIAGYVKSVDSEDAFIGGLLHDIGNVVLNNEFPQRFSEVMEMVYNDSVPYSTAVKEVFGFTHRDVGALVVRKWGFPETLEVLIRYFDDHEHLSADPYLLRFATVIATADRICQKFGVGWKQPMDDVVDFDTVADVLEIEKETLDEVCERTQKVFDHEIKLYLEESTRP